MKVLVVAEFYPRKSDPTNGIWAHRQALAAKAAGADVQVVVLNRLIPPKSALRKFSIPALTAPIRQPRRSELDGIPVTYLPYISPSRSRSYQNWDRWVAPVLRRQLDKLYETFPYDLIHAHYAAPAAAAVLRADRKRKPLIVSVHGADVIGLANWHEQGRKVVAESLKAADLVVVNSKFTARKVAELGIESSELIHLGSDTPSELPLKRPLPTLVTVANLVPRKRHDLVLKAIAHLRNDLPGLSYFVIGAGPQLSHLQQLASDLQIEDRVYFLGMLPHEQALRQCWQCHLAVLPSHDETFGVAYIEAMAGGIPAIGVQGEGGPEEIAELGGGIKLVPPDDYEALAEMIKGLLSDERSYVRLAQTARETVRKHFTWQLCGEQTIAAYNKLLDSGKRA